MLFESLDRIKRNTLMSTVVLMFFGLVLLLLPEAYFPFLSSALGFALAVLFVYTILRFLSREKNLMAYIKLSLGLLSGVFACAFFIFDGLLLAILSWLVGTLPILFGVYGIYHAIAFARRSGRKGWWMLIVLSACLIVFGSFVFWNPWMDSTHAFIQIIGGTLLYSAFVSALSLIWLWPIHKENE